MKNIVTILWQAGEHNKESLLIRPTLTYQKTAQGLNEYHWYFNTAKNKLGLNKLLRKKPENTDPYLFMNEMDMKSCTERAGFMISQDVSDVSNQVQAREIGCTELVQTVEAIKNDTCSLRHFVFVSFSGLRNLTFYRGTYNAGVIECTEVLQASMTSIQVDKEPTYKQTWQPVLKRLISKVVEDIQLVTLNKSKVAELSLFLVKQHKTDNVYPLFMPRLKMKTDSFKISFQYTTKIIQSSRTPKLKGQNKVKIQQELVSHTNLVLSPKTRVDRSVKEKGDRNIFTQTSESSVCYVSERCKSSSEYMEIAKIHTLDKCDGCKQQSQMYKQVGYNDVVRIRKHKKVPRYGLEEKQSYPVCQDCFNQLMKLD